MPGIQVCSDQSFVYLRSWASILSRDSFGHGTTHRTVPRCRLQWFLGSKLQEKQQEEGVSNKETSSKSLAQNVSTIAIMLSAQNDKMTAGLIFSIPSLCAFSCKTQLTSKTRATHRCEKGIYRIWVEDLMKIWSKFLYLCVIVPCPTWTWDVHLSAPQHSSVEIQAENLS